MYYELTVEEFRGASAQVLELTAGGTCIQRPDFHLDLATDSGEVVGLQ